MNRLHEAEVSDTTGADSSNAIDSNPTLTETIPSFTKALED